MSNFRLDFKGSLADGAFWSTRLYATGNIAEATAATAAHTAIGDLWSAITTYMPTTSTVDSSAAVTLNTSWKNATRTETAETLAGTSADESMPLRTSAVITWRTAVAAKGKNGRSFLPAAAFNAIDTAASTGNLLAAFQSAVSTGAGDFLTALTSAGLTVILLDRKDFSNVTITSAQCANKFRTQRRRDDKGVVSYV